MKIVSIGGGEIGEGETEAIDRYICELSGARTPRVLFIPTASGDAAGYCRNVEALYGRRLGCRVEHLLLLGERPDLDKVRELIGWADVLYVGGGNTALLLDTWRRLGVDAEIKGAALNGAVLSGLSAGALCWYQFGLSDVDRFSGDEDWRYRCLPALGWLPGLFCPHLDVEHRQGPLIDHLLTHGGTALACDNGAAVCCLEGVATVRTSLQGAHAYTYSSSGAGVVIRRFGNGQRLPVASL